MDTHISGTAGTLVRQRVALTTCTTTLPDFPGKSRFLIVFFCPTPAHTLLSFVSLTLVWKTWSSTIYVAQSWVVASDWNTDCVQFLLELSRQDSVTTRSHQLRGSGEVV